MGLILKNDNIKNVLQALTDGINDGLEAVGQAAEGYAIDNLQAQTHGTGNLATHMAHEVDADAKKVYIGNNEPYAAYVELGTGIYYPSGRKTAWVYMDENGNFHKTHGRQATPYLVPAARDHSKEYIEILAEAVKAHDKD